jgi:hypothetical protein
MAFSNAQKLQSLGVPTPLAIELGDQLASGTGDSRRLQELSLAPSALADYVAASITAAEMDGQLATRYGMDTVLAKFLADQVNA